MAKLRATVSIDEEKCKSCELCIPVCPPQVLRLADHFNGKGYHPVQLVGECTGCEMCFLVCPDYVLEIYRGSAAAVPAEAGA